MLTIITAGKSSAEKAAITVARERGIKCVALKPRRRGPGRRSYRQCLQINATDADATLMLGDTVPPGGSELELILDCHRPTSSIAIRVALRFSASAADTHKWLKKHRVQTLHVTGTAPTAMAKAFLRAVLAKCRR